MKCAILDYEKGELRILDLTDDLKEIESKEIQSEKIEKILTEKYGYSLKTIEYMTVETLNIRWG